MAIIKCKMCGGDILLSEDKTYGTCDSCGCTMTLPRAADEQKANLYNRANHYRRQCDFDKAVAAYERILEADDRDAEAHWGVVISRFGIEYVEDPASHDYIPTCHRVQAASILKDEDYLAALQYAPDGYSRGLYEKEAARIADIQKGILAISANEEPYDVFICYKETTEGGTRTKDSTLAQEIYYQLTNEGYKVFFSRITLEDKLGQQYEPYIFAALNSAKVMLVVGSKPEYFNAVWVRNEWSRYLDIARQDRSKLLIPCYRDMDAYDLPEELGSFQSQDMSKIGFMQDLIRGVRKVLDAGKEESKPAAAVQGGPGVASLLTRARLFMEDGDFASAGEYVEKALDIDPKCAEAYIVKTAVNHRLKSDADLGKLKESIAADPDYVKALRFADPKQKAEYAGYEQSIQQGIANRAKAERYHSARYEYQHANSIDTFLAASRSLAALGDYEDAAALSAKARAQAEELRQQQLKQEEARRLEAEKKKEMERARQAKEAEERKQRELERQHRQEEQRLARQAAAKRNKKIAKIVIPIVAALTAIVMVVVFVVVPKSKYNSGIEYREKGQYLQAINVFSELSENGYSDSAEQLKETKYMQAQSLLKSGKTDEAIRIFNEIAPYKESRNFTSQAQADALFAKKQYKEAYALYAKLPAAYRTHADWYLQQYDDAVAVLNGGDPAAAQAMFENISYYAEKDVAGQITECRYQQAAALQEAGQYKAAADIFGAIPHYKDSLNRAYQCTGDDYYDRGNLTEAYDYYQLADEAYRTHADDYAAMYADAQAKQEAGQYDEAIAVYTSISNYEQSAAKIDECRYLKAGVLAAEGNYDAAIALYDELGDYSDSSSLSAKAKADQLYDAGSYAAAYDAYAALDEAYQTHAADYAAMYADAQAKQEAGQYDEAVAVYASISNYEQSAAKIDECRYLKAGVLAAEGNYDAAIALYDELGDYSDSSSLSARAKADQLYDAGSYAAAYDAYAALGEAYQTNEAGYAAMYADALALQTAGKYDEAEAAFAALGNYGDSTAQISETRYLKAGSLAAAGNYDAAIALYDGLGDYSDSKNLSARAKADKLYEAGSYAAAYNVYAALGEAYQTNEAGYAAMYADALALQTAGKYDDAEAAFAALGNYGDSTAQISETRYLKAGSLAAAGSYDAAIALYDSLGDYSDSKDRSAQAAADRLFDAGSFAEAYDGYAALDEKYHTHADDYAAMYADAEAARVGGDFDNAYDRFIALGNYSDTGEKAVQCGKDKADSLFAAENYGEAAQVYAFIGDAEKANESTYLYAGQLAGQGEYLQAAQQYESVSDYRDSLDQRYQMGLQARVNGKLQDAYEILSADPDYRDAREAIYQTGVAASAQKLYEVSVPAFTQVGAYKDSAMKLTMDTYAWGGQLYDNGEYDRSAEVFDSMGEFSDAPARANAARYAAAGVAMQNGAYDDAAARYEALGDYKDSAERARNAAYAAADEKLEAGEYADAKARFEKLGTFKDSKDKVQECDYRPAMDLFNAGDYAAAKAAFLALGSYSNSADMAKECDYIPAKALYDAKQYADALNMFERNGLAGYKDAGNLMNDCRYQLGKAEMLAGDYAAARDWFDAAGNYSDAKAQGDECRYQLALALKNDGLYDDAITAFDAIAEYSDSWSQINACYDAKAAVYESAGDYEAAYAQYELAGNTAKTREMAYQTALVKLSGSDYESAVAWYEKAGDYSDAKEQILNIGEYYYATQQYDAAETVYVKVVGTGVAAQRLYELGQYYELVGDLERAAKAYGEAGDYEDAPEKATAMQTEATYQTAESLLVAKDWEGAKAEYLKIPGYKDADSKVTACDNEIAAAREAKLKPYKTVGSYVTYGTYPQTNVGNDSTPIEWLVLEYDAKNNRALLISRYGLDCQPYNSSYASVTWETCSLRTWLNGTFLNKAFSKAEQGAILTTDVDNSSSQGYSGWSTKGGNNTQDKVFLLSYGEANKYFNVTYSDSNNTKSRVAPTAYAIAQGVDTSSSDKTADGSASGVWWLRSPSSLQDFAASVITDGSLYRSYVNHYNCSVRPAFWLDLSAIETESTSSAGKTVSNHEEPEGGAIEGPDEAVSDVLSGQDFTVGNYVTYGTYPQTKAGNDSTPIEWLVLDYDAKNNKALLISRYGLDCQKYNSSNTSVTWETCSLRTWLNGTFLNKAFSKAEQGAILTTNVDNSKSQCYSGYSTNGGNNTQDKIFLLSYAEANKYFNVEDGEVSGADKNTKSRVAPTAYAIAQGVDTSSSDKTADGSASGMWWLRSPGIDRDCAAFVYPDGSLISFDVDLTFIAVRPAFWLDLSGI